MNWRLMMAIVVATVAPIASHAEDSLVLARMVMDPPPTKAYCSTHPNCGDADLQMRWTFTVRKQLRGPKVPHKVFALRYGPFPPPPPPFWDADPKGAVLVVLTPITDESLRKRTGASYLISDLSFTMPMYCLESPPDAYGIEVPETEIYVSPGAKKQCFNIFWAGTLK